LTKKTISKAKPAAKPVKLKSGAALKTKARPIAHKKVKPEPKKPEAKKVPVKPVKVVVAKPAPKLPTKVTAKEPAKPQQSPLVKRSEEVKKTVSKPEPVRAVLGKESLKIPGKIDPKAKKNGAAGPDAAQPGTPPKEESDAPLLDLSDAAVRKMITRAKQRGYVTYDELNRVLPSDKVSSEQIEDTMAMLNEMGINVIESEEQEEGEGAELPAVASGRQVAEVAEKAEETYDRTDDPVRMYLREMGSVELLSREGEIAIAKRIEAGRELMIGALCEGPLTFEALTVWRDELNEGKALLRDIIGLEATYQGPDAKPAPSQPLPGEAGANGEAVAMNGNGHAQPQKGEASC
jgi:RNA polymerase primary sigma factor